MRLMRTSIFVGGICAALGLSLAVAAPSTASAACSAARTGTIVGGVGGALIGNSVSRGAGGIILGGLGGAVVGHEIGKSTCGSARHYSYNRPSRRATYRYERRRPSYYYDSYGRPVYSSAGYRYGACRTETRAYYDERGVLVRRSVNLCDR